MSGVRIEQRVAEPKAVQAKCACNAAGARDRECESCRSKRVQRSAAGAPAAESVAAVDDVLASAGAPLDPSTRGALESRFNYDFGGVRIHADARAAASAHALGALAYTVGSHIVFGAGRFAPGVPAGRRLLAHELTHTIQQGHAGALQRQAEVSAPGDPAEAEADRVAEEVTQPAAAGLIVDDDAAEVAQGQMRRTEFLDEVQRASCAAADAELARVGRSTEGCPFVERAFARYRTMPGAQVETAVRRYIPDDAGVTAARDYIPLVSRRVAQGVARWAQTGEMGDVPPELAAEATGEGPGILGILGGGLAGVIGGIGRLMFKRHDDAAVAGADAEDPVEVASQLGPGAPLDAAVQARMERAFGYDFANVRIHADEPVTSSLGARAFTVGRDIAFAPSEYRPGTPPGDALIAHELAHVVQQGGGVQTKGAASGSIEEDADRAAVGAMVSIWSGMGRGLARVAEGAMPRLRSGLALQRCGGQQRANPAVARPPTAAQLETMTPYAISELPESYFAGATDRMADFARTRRVVLWVRSTLRTRNPNAYTDRDVDTLGVLGLPPGTAGPALEAIRSRVIAAPTVAPNLPQASGGAAVNRAPFRIVSLADLQAKSYQAAAPILGSQAETLRLLRAIWSELQITPVDPSRSTVQERRAAVLFQMYEFPPSEENAHYNPRDNVIYITRRMADLAAGGGNAATTVAHEVTHSIAGAQRNVDAFRTFFGGDQWQCYFLVFEEGMTETTAREAQAPPAGRSYEEFVQVMRLVRSDVGDDVVRRAHLSGNIGRPVMESIRRHVAERADLGPLCAGAAQPSGMTPFELTQLAEPAAAALGPQFVRARTFIQCVMTRHGVTYDFDRVAELGTPPPAEDLARYEAIRAQVTTSAAVTANLPAGSQVNSAPFRIVRGIDWAVKRYQLQLLLTGIGDRGENAVRHQWPQCGINPAANAQPTEQERKAALLDFSTQQPAGDSFYFPTDNVIYISGPVADDLHGGSAAAAATVGHEVAHSVAGRRRTEQAFREYFAGERWICYWSVFEEGMTEITSRAAMGTGGASSSGYQNEVDVMEAISTQVGREGVRRAYFEGNPGPEIFEQLRVRVPRMPEAPAQAVTSACGGIMTRGAGSR